MHLSPQTFREWIADRKKRIPVILMLIFIVFLESFIETYAGDRVFGPVVEALALSWLGSTALVLSVRLNWLLVVLVTLVVIFWLAGRPRIYRSIIILFLTYVTAMLSVTVIALFLNIFFREGPNVGLTLLRDAGVVWILNVIVFTIWYWLLDSDNYDRRRSGFGRPLDFCFPQYSTVVKDYENWRPNLFDYFFISFTTSATFTPYSDTQVLSRRAKLLVSVDIFHSVVMVVIIAARALGVLSSGL